MSPTIIDDSKTEIERILNYMDWDRELIGEHLYIMVGMKNYFFDSEMQGFIDTVVSHRYQVLLLESRKSVKLLQEKRMILNNDICEI